VGAMALIWSLWLCRNDKVFNEKIVIFCRWSIGAPKHFVFGHSFTGWRITTSLRRCALG
jgi:hypothetical protein